MANFSYADYQKAVAQAQADGDGAKVGYFKLKNDGDIAIARINVASVDELMFASVHTINAGGKWIKVSCLNPLGMTGGGCGLCAAYSANPNGAVSKPAKKLFIPMMVSYRDPNAASGYTAPAPVIWDRPAAFSRELANKLMIAGDLRNTLVLITRNGKAGDMQTTYSMDILPETHPVFKPEMIPMDFGAFNNFNIARHSYWEKSADEIQVYLTTGQFPERTQTGAGQVTSGVGVGVPQAPQPAYTAPTYTTPPQAAQAPTFSQPNVVPQTAQGTGTVNPTPSRSFNGFSF